MKSALSFITCGSVDDGKSTLIGRLLLDSNVALQDQIAQVSKRGAMDLALFTDGLAAEREQGITIDVAYRYFATPARKFIIGDTPGHEQYTRNMVTAASNAQAAVVLVDATKLRWQSAAPTLLPQTRRHSLLLKLLQVPTLVYAVNKLDAVGDGQGDAVTAFENIRAALSAFAAQAGIAVHAVVPISALLGFNVVEHKAHWCGYREGSLLRILENAPDAYARGASACFAAPVQWVEKFSSSSDTHQGRRIFWAKVASGRVAAGDAVVLHPGGMRARVAQVLDATRLPSPGVETGASAGIILDQEIDLSRGDWLFGAENGAGGSSGEQSGFSVSGAVHSQLPQQQWEGCPQPRRELTATVAWLDDVPLVPGRVYHALHGHRWVKAKVKAINYVLDVHDLSQSPASTVGPNAIAQVVLTFNEGIAALDYATNKVLGSMILVDTATHQTAAAALLEYTS